MRIERVEIRNFRCLQNVELHLNPTTVLIGPNGTGKSSVIRALELFFGVYKADRSDGSGENESREISVSVTFGDLADEQYAEVEPWLDASSRLRLTCRCAAASEWQPRFESHRRQIEAFAEVRSATSADEMKAAYGRLRESGDFAALPTATTKVAILAALNGWEEANRDQRVPVLDGSLGIGSGYQKNIGSWFFFLTIPAARDPSPESSEARAGSFRELVKFLLPNREGIAAPLNELQQRSLDKAEQIVRSRGERPLARVQEALTQRLQGFAPGAAVELQWHLPIATITQPTLQAKLVESGYATAVGKQGHGVQRAFEFAVLHALAEKRAANLTSAPLLILGIEEPELYQHPARARFLNRVLHELALGSRQPTQVIYATHSPQFITLDVVQELRLFRLESDATNLPRSSVESVDLDQVAAELWEASGRKGPPFSGRTLRPRLRQFMETSLAEGFFARAVVLVEGPEDRAIISASAQVADLDLERKNIALLEANGKDYLDKPTVIFRALGLPTFVVFDCDDNASGKQRNKTALSNRSLLRLLGEPEADFPVTTVSPTCAYFATNIATTVKGEIGAKEFDATLKRASTRSGYANVEDARKNATVLGHVLGSLFKRGHRSETLDRIVERIDALTTT